MKAGIVSLSVIMCLGSWLRLVDHAGAGRCRRRRLDQEVRRRQQAGRRDSRSRGRVVFVHEQHREMTVIT
jgi:hypothetical protein